MGSIVAEIADKIASAGGGERSELEVRGGTGADGGGTLTLSTSELTVVDGDKLGRIDFQAPLETGDDALLVGASIYAEADDTFAADNNSTELVFATGASEAAAEKMRITSDGKVGIGTATPVTDLTVEGPITIKEQAAADADTAGYGQIWVDDAVKSPLVYTNDAGDDIHLTIGDSTVSGSGAFCATGAGTGWVTAADTAILVFGNDSQGDNFDDDGIYNTSTYKYEVPATGIYYFWMSIYTANSDVTNGFGFTSNNGELNLAAQGDNHFLFESEGNDDRKINASLVMRFAAGDTVWCAARMLTEYVQDRSQWGGCRLS